jgi:hypothetical protein
VTAGGNVLVELFAGHKLKSLGCVGRKMLLDLMNSHNPIIIDEAVL